MAIDVKRLDRDVLDALANHGVLVTYVLRNTLSASWRDYGWRAELKTSQVLAACRRLEVRGHVEEASTSYATYKAWRITEAGRAEQPRTVEHSAADNLVLEDPARPGWWAYRQPGTPGDAPAVVGGFPTATAARRAAVRAAAAAAS